MSKYFICNGNKVLRTNHTHVGDLIWDNTWGKYRFKPKEDFDFDKEDLHDLAILIKEATN